MPLNAKEFYIKESVDLGRDEEAAKREIEQSQRWLDFAQSYGEYRAKPDGNWLTIVNMLKCSHERTEKLATDQLGLTAPEIRCKECQLCWTEGDKISSVARYAYNVGFNSGWREGLKKEAAAKEGGRLLWEAACDVIAGLAFIRGAIGQQNFGTAVEYIEMHDKNLQKACDKFLFRTLSSTKAAA